MAHDDNNNNNCETSIAPISSKIIQLSGVPSTGVGQTHSPVSYHRLTDLIRIIYMIKYLTYLKGIYESS